MLIFDPVVLGAGYLWFVIVGFATETATFILECADDDNDDVVRECKRLKDAVERETGKIEGI